MEPNEYRLPSRMPDGSFPVASSTAKDIRLNVKSYHGSAVRVLAFLLVLLMACWHEALKPSICGQQGTVKVCSLIRDR